VRRIVKADYFSPPLEVKARAPDVPWLRCPTEAESNRQLELGPTTTLVPALTEERISFGFVGSSFHSKVRIAMDKMPDKFKNIVRVRKLALADGRACLQQCAIACPPTVSI
jgi:hypothetical protein